jgi:carbamoyltransferase
MPKHYYIGLAVSLHDSAIAIVDDNGEVLFAEAAERRYQVKRAIGCPPDNIVWATDLIKKYCEPNAAYTITKSWSKNRTRKLDLVNLSGIARFDLNERMQTWLLNATGPLPGDFNDTVFMFKNAIAMTMNAGTGFERAIRDRNAQSIVKNIAYDHHLSHAGSACYGSPFNEAVCLVADGSGEGGAFSIYKYKNGKISLLEKQIGPETLGGFYERLTSFCHFNRFKGEEWKVMGLSAYGSFDEQLYKLFRSLYYVDGSRLRQSKADLNKILREIYDIASADPGDLFLRANIAYNGQLAYSEWMNEFITNIHKKYPCDDLILTGGCALNSSYNGTILDNTPFKHLYVPSAPADDGNALGGALLAYYADHTHSESIHKNISPYLGTEITDEQLTHFLRFSGLENVRKLSDDKYETVAKLLAEGKIIGWVQGKAEFGPRALGNRSILADPRKKEMKDIINERVKFREEFRPFAPCILHEFGHEYFEHYQESHYMERALRFKKQAIDKVPGVVHEDSTGRLQSVKEEWNAELYHLIKAFYGITGAPVLLNTSFNVMGKPIIHTIENAISTYFTTGIDALVINDLLIEK